MYLQIFEINEISNDFNEITGFLSDFKSRTGFWGVSYPSPKIPISSRVQPVSPTGIDRMGYYLGPVEEIL